MNKYNGMKRASDWVGKTVELVHPVATRAMWLPAGCRGTIFNQSDGALDFQADPCPHCGVRPYVRRLSYFEVRLVE